MTRVTRPGFFMLCATLIGAALAAQGTEAPPATTAGPCNACLEVCRLPLSYEDSVLDESTDSYMLPAARQISTAAAIAMAARLNEIHREYKAGHFGRAFESNAAAIESLARKQAQERATSAEIRSLKSVRAALYADTAVGLQAAAKGSRSAGFVAGYQARSAVLDSLVTSLSAAQPMRAAERLAVCEVLSAYEGR
jgi:hypothetical protein